MSNKLSAVIAAGSVLAISTSSALAADAGWYIGVNAGQSSTDVDKEDLDDVVIDAFFSAGAPVLTGTSTMDDSDTSFGVTVGYQFNPSFALEGGYLQLGSVNYRSTGTINPPGPVTSTPATANIDFESSGFTLGGAASVPIGDIFALHAKLGVFFASTDTDVRITATGATGTGNESASTQEIYYGIGVDFKLGEHWRLGLDWTLYNDVGDEEETGEASVSNLSAAVSFHF